MSVLAVVRCCCQSLLQSSSHDFFRALSSEPQLLLPQRLAQEHFEPRDGLAATSCRIFQKTRLRRILDEVIYPLPGQAFWTQGRFVHIRIHANRSRVDQKVPANPPKLFTRSQLRLDILREAPAP